MSILALGRKHKKEENPQSKKGRKQKKERKFSIKRGRESRKIKKKKENPRSKIGRKQKKHAERSLDQTIYEQYKIVTKKTKKKRKEIPT